MIAVATLNGAKNIVPWFITANGPVREARFKKTNGVADGNVHALFVITGRAGAPGCNISQFDFIPAGNPLTGQGGNPNIIFRIPAPVFGAGLVEAIPDSAILANMQSNAAEKSAIGIRGHVNAHLSGNVNRSGNDGTITRFGWKAQNKSLLIRHSGAIPLPKMIAQINASLAGWVTYFRIGNSSRAFSEVQCNIGPPQVDAALLLVYCKICRPRDLHIEGLCRYLGRTWRTWAGLAHPW